MKSAKPIKMKHAYLPSESIRMFDDISQCLEDWASLMPKSGHSSLTTQWKSDMKDYIDCIYDEEDKMVESITSGLVEAFSEWDDDDFVESVNNEQTYALMQRPQTTQRTSDWYTEFKRCLTASEIYKVFGSPRERGQLVLQKSGKLDMPGRASQSVAIRQNMSPFDWGICFEPVVKQILELDWSAIIHEVGRFVHLVDTRLAASPDGLIIRSLKNPEMGGHLLEIKCPKSRQIGVKIPMEYFYQMQLQLEVTGVRACEYVEAKFDFSNAEEAADSKWCGSIAVVGCFNEERSHWLPCKYLYGPIGDLKWTPDLGLNEKVLELNIWKCDNFHHERVYRNEAWFASLIPGINEFWQDVARSVEGSFVAPESSRKKKEVACLIVDE